MKYKYAAVRLTFGEQTTNIDADVVRSVDGNPPWSAVVNLNADIQRTSNPDDVTGFLWSSLISIGNADARTAWIQQQTDTWAATAVLTV